MADSIHFQQAKQLEPQVFSAPVDLVIGTENEINAFAAGSGNAIRITLAIAELIADSPSELAHLVAHELGHIYQFRTGDERVFHANAEKDADIWGMILALRAGYDPYAGAGALSKIAMATGTADLVSQATFHNRSIADAHGSFNARVATVYEEILRGCSEVPALCNTIKSVLHPHFPASAPLLQIHDPGRKR